MKMNKNFILLNKITISILIAAAFYNLWAPFPGVWSQVFNIGLVSLLVVHHFEALIFIEKHRRSDISLMWHGFQILLFGVLHTASLKIPEEKLATAS